MILQIGSNIGALAVVLAVVWWRVGKVDRSIDRIWSRLNAHCDNRDIHPDPDRLRRIERLLNGGRGRDD